MENVTRQPQPFYEFKAAVLESMPGRFVYETDLRKLHKQGMTAADALAHCRAHNMVHVREKTAAGRPRTVGINRGRYLPHETVMRRIADANHYVACKLLKHSLDEDDLKMVRKLKEDSERVVFEINAPREYKPGD